MIFANFFLSIPIFIKLIFRTYRRRKLHAEVAGTEDPSFESYVGRNPYKYSTIAIQKKEGKASNARKTMRTASKKKVETPEVSVQSHLEVFAVGVSETAEEEEDDEPPFGDAALARIYKEKYEDMEKEWMGMQEEAGEWKWKYEDMEKERDEARLAYKTLIKKLQAIRESK